ncbi:ABC transporter ATP-binding protein [Desulfosporosinus sp. BICA1-9]|uniref:ABC transporter ATP-binding protein n=1 Tax=Desulfosporosinus sp. BICA1-9 TaxID=1531958 RepID=UPI00054B1092|nr:ABC transporter ATP-binding protein [Desulfosporosinus sp. BICA1-9]KJS50490.1 MAG: hypothetical protein VR66_02520 [Peptococcaceae bacterium BRH_c23]KJS90734.1 MAG: hypothetical protein JL57_00225 [Desulfosporosinus sp. BICA1-9]HBW33967.1 ABC transporter ATP-binding protein [Desulfosporosinus sp.]
MEPLLRISDLHVDFLGYAGVTRVLNGIDLELFPGEFLGLVGESGSGKSLTANSVLGLLPKRSARISKGSIMFEGQELVGKPEKEFQSIRGKKISMVFQEPMNALNPSFKIGTQMAEILKLHKGLTSKEAKVESVRWLSRVRIPHPERIVNEYPFELSGGMRQRVLLAMALGCGAKLLLADEPTTALDVTIQAQILQLMKETADQLGTSVLLITHDLAVVAQTCRRVAVMYSGNIVESGPVGEVLHRPRHPYTIALLQALPNPDGKQNDLRSIPGSVPNLLTPPSGCRFHPRCTLAEKKCREIRPLLTSISENHYVACWRDGHHA